MGISGREIHGELHSTNASSGVAIPIYEAGGVKVVTLKSNEFIDIDSCSIVTVAGGDSYVNFGASAAILVGKTILRGTFAANGGLSKDFNRSPRSGPKGETVWCTSPSGVVNVQFTGRITSI